MRKIAFVIITMGKSDYLEDMLRSLENYEKIILVDNSLEGNCKSLIGKYRFTYTHELKPGVSNARNAGAALVGNVDYIYFLDDDLSLGEEWHHELKSVLSGDSMPELIGGRVVADYPRNLSIPEKYLYLVGEKYLGDSEKTINTDYVGGCNLLVKAETFFSLGGFDSNFGHIGSTIGLNEDVVFQELIRKNHGTIYYNPKLIFYHHWRGSDDDLLKRVKLQGLYDRQTDLRTNKLRFILRNIKYVLFIAFHGFLLSNENVCEEKYWDYLRYSAYVNNK